MTNPFDIPFAGIDLGAVPLDNIQSIAFGRSNVMGGDPCGGGVCTDRHLGLYTLEYTQVPNPSVDLDIDSTGNPTTGWAEIGTLGIRHQRRGGDELQQYLAAAPLQLRRGECHGTAFHRARHGTRRWHGD